MKKQIMLPVLLILLVVGSVFASAQLFGPSSSSDNEQPRTVTVSGVYTAQVAPDQAQFSVSVETQESTAKESIAANKQIAAKVIAALKSAGVDAKDIQTQGYYTYKKEECNYDEPIVMVAQKGMPVPGYESSEPSYYPRPCTYKTVGWITTNTISVTTKNLENVGSYIDVASNAGATGINGVSFSLSTQKQSELEKTMLEGAAKNAKDKAESLAGALGARIGRVMVVSESYYSPLPTYYKSYATMDSEGLGASTPVEPGQLDTSKQVSVTFELT